MKRMLIAIFALTGVVVFGAPPHCETKILDGQEFQGCERADQSCESLISEQLKRPSPQWNGCGWPANIILSVLKVQGLIAYNTHVMIIPSFKDSERVEITVQIPLANGRSKTDKKSVEVIVQDGIPNAKVDFWTVERPEASGNFAFDTGLQRLTVTGIAGTAAIDVPNGWVQSAGGFLSTGTSYQTVNIGSGGVSAKSLHALNYTQLGGSFGIPPATAGNTLGNGSIYYDTQVNLLRVMINGGWQFVATGNVGFVNSVTGTAPISVSPTSGACVVSISATPTFTSVDMTSLKLGGVAVASSSGGWQMNNVCYASQFGIYGVKNGISGTFTLNTPTGTVTLTFLNGLFVPN